MLSPYEIIARKNLVSSTRADGSGISCADWMRFKAGLKDRAFWVSNVESLKFVKTCRDGIADLLANRQNADGALTSRAEIVSRIMRAAREAGIDTGADSVRNPGSVQRADVVVDTNAGLAAGYAASMQSNTYGARLAFPAQELVRIEARIQPRQWISRWTAAGGRLFAGRMIALKNDPVWTRISRFGTPYPPFDFNSGMGVDAISHEEAVALGVIDDAYIPPKDSPLKNFNAYLKADMEFKNDAYWRSIKRAFGDQIRNDGNGIVWRQEAIKDAFLSKKHFELDLGVSSPALKRLLPSDRLRSLVDGKSFTLDSRWLHRKRKNGLDHYSHFEPLETGKNNIGLTPDDLELLPILFRAPDQVFKGSGDAFICTLNDGEGGNYCLVLNVKQSIRIKTFLRLKPGIPVEEALNNKSLDR